MIIQKSLGHKLKTGSAITWKYPSVVFAQGDNSVENFYSVAIASKSQQADTGTKMVHLGKNTKSNYYFKRNFNNEGEKCLGGLRRVGKVHQMQEIYLKM